MSWCGNISNSRSECKNKIAHTEFFFKVLWSLYTYVIYEESGKEINLFRSLVWPIYFRVLSSCKSSRLIFSSNSTIFHLVSLTLESQEINLQLCHEVLITMLVHLYNISFGLFNEKKKVSLKIYLFPPLFFILCSLRWSLDQRNCLKNFFIHLVFLYTFFFFA